MNSAIKRILSALALLTIFALALSLRFYGLDWGFHHPDEWHYRGCAEDMNIQGLTLEEKKLPWQDQARLYYERNLKVVEGESKVGHPGLKIRNYNYGTFPLYLYYFYDTYLKQHFHPEQGWNFLAFPDWLSIGLLLFALFLGVRMFLGLSRDLREIEGRKLPWYQDEKRMMFLFPCLIIPVTGLVLAAFLPNLLVDLTRYQPNSMPFLVVGRAVTAYAGALTILLAYLIGRDAYNRTAGLIAAVMMATAMLHVQTSHFCTTDVILGFLSTGAVYSFLKLSQKPRLIWYILGAVFTGFAVGSKWGGVTLPGILFVAHAIATLGDQRNGKVGRWIHAVWLLLTGLILAHFLLAARSVNPPVNETLAVFRDFYWSNLWWFAGIKAIIFFASIYLLVLRKRWHGGQTGWFVPAVQIYKPWVWLSLAIVMGLAAFMVAEPMAYFDAKEFGKNISEQAGLIVTGERPIVYTQQYRHTLPVLYSLDNLFYPSLDWITAFFVIGGCLYALGRLYNDKKSSSDLLLSAWVFPSFILYSCVYCKFPRYMDAILPVMMVMGARWIVDLARIQPSVYLPSMPSMGEGWRRAARNVGRYGGALALVCGLIYGVSYVGIYSRPHTLVEAGNWVKANKKPEDRVSSQSWDNGIGIHVERDNQIGIHTNADQNMRNPQQVVDYYANILDRNDYIVMESKRGYGTTLQNPDRFPVTNQFLRAMFAEQLGFRAAKVFDNPPRFLGWRFYTDEEDETARVYDHPKVIVFEKNEKFTQAQYKDLINNPPEWVSQITKEEILNLRDGHPVYATPPNHPVLSWAIMLYALGWLAFILLFPIAAYLPDRGYAISKIVGLALFAWLSWFLASTGMMNVSFVQGLFVLAVLAVCAALVLRSRGGEIRKFIGKKVHLLIGLEILFLVVWGLFLVIKAYHPAATGGEKPMNMAFINAVYRADTFPPEDPWMSGFPVNYYYYGQAIFSLAGRFAGVPPEYLFNIAGTCVTALAALAIFSLTFALARKVWIGLLATYLCCFAGHFWSYYNFVKFEYIRSGRAEEAASIGIKECFSALFPIVQHMWYALLYYTGMASQEIATGFRQFNYDQLFWSSSRVIPNTVANEFPAWTHLFLDFHAHMLVIPFTFAFLVLLYNYFAQPKQEFRLGNMAGMTFLLGLLLGTVICTNTWDLPALGIALILITIVKFYREADWFNQPAVRPEVTTPDGLHKLLQFPITPIVLICGLSIALFIPFKTFFISRVNSVGIMTEGNTLITTYLGFWAHVLLPIVAAAILFAAVRNDGRISLKRAILFVTFYMLSVALAIWVTRVNLFGFPSPDNPQYPPLNYSLVGLFLPIFLVFFLMMWRRKQSPEFVFACLIGVLGLGLSLGIEVFHIVEHPWYRPSHRWNTAFKFNLQVWHYLSIAAAVSCVWVWRQFDNMSAHIGKWFKYSAKLDFLFAMILVLIPTLPFAVLAPIVLTTTGGADMRSPRPTLDGLAYLREEDMRGTGHKYPGSYKAIQWCNRFLEGTPHIVELSYRHGGDHARFSSYTGLPALIGWPHHTRERMHYVSHLVNERVRDMDRIYDSNDIKEILRLTGQYNLQYLMFGKIEQMTRRGDQSDRPPLGKEGLERIEGMGGLFQLVYRNEDNSIFKINKSLNRIYGMETDPRLAIPPALRPPEQGVSMYQAGHGSSNGQFLEPRGLAVDAAGNIFVADTRNHRLQVFHPDGSFAWKTGEQGAGKNEFNEPNDVALDPQSNRLYVVDTWNNRVTLYDTNGLFLGKADFSSFGPRGIVMHPKWRFLYITDTGNHRVIVMSPQGKILQTWGRKGNEENTLREPVGIDVMPDGNVIVVDSLNRRTMIYTPQGERIGGWPIQTKWDGDGGFESHVACAPDGTIYLTDPKEGSVHVYNASGELQEKITMDLNRKKLMTPIGITVTPQNQVLVSDLGRSQIARVR